MVTDVGPVYSDTSGEDAPMMYHKMNVLLFLITSILALVGLAKGQSYEDARCKCICNVINKNNSQVYKKLYIASVPPDNNCDSVILPPTEGPELNNRTQEICPRCECKYESRNTTIIKVGVIIVVWVISLLLVYMMFLMCLDPILNNRIRGINYMEHSNEEDETVEQREITSSGRPSQMSISAPGPSVIIEGPLNSSGSNVLNRVTHQQDKWKKQVREQRRHIYDQHMMLN